MSEKYDKVVVYVKNTKKLSYIAKELQGDNKMSEIECRVLNKTVNDKYNDTVSDFIDSDKKSIIVTNLFPSDVLKIDQFAKLIVYFDWPRITER
jgi:hypothetical protein